MKQDLFFAQDKTATASVIANLETLMAATPELVWAAVIDGAFDYPPESPLPYTLTGENCFNGAAFEGLESAAPWLVPIPRDEQGRNALRTLIRHCSGRPMLSFVAAQNSVPYLADSWAHLHWVHDEEGQRMLLRFADTRILPVLPNILTTQQWSAYTRALSHWVFIGREGRLQECPMADSLTTAEDKIVISQTQMNTLLDSAEPDAVIDLLKETMSDILPDEFGNAQLFSFVNERCLMARQYGVRAFSDLISLVVASFLILGRDNKNETLTNLLRLKSWKAGELGEAILAAEIIEESE